MDVTKLSTYLSNISLAFPISSKIKMGLLYQPYSSKSYDIINTETIKALEESAKGIGITSNVSVEEMLNEVQKVKGA